MKTQERPEPSSARGVSVDVVEVDEPADVERGVRHYVQLALAQIGIPVIPSRNAAA